MKRFVLALLLAACSDSTAPPVDHTFELAWLLDTYPPGRVLDGGAIESATLELRADGTLELTIEAWQGEADVSQARTGTWSTVGGWLDLRLDGQSFAGSGFGTTPIDEIDEFPFATVEPEVLGPEPIWFYLQNSVWVRP